MKQRRHQGRGIDQRRSGATCELQAYLLLAVVRDHHCACDFTLLKIRRTCCQRKLSVYGHIMPIAGCLTIIPARLPRRRAYVLPLFLSGHLSQHLPDRSSPIFTARCYASAVLAMGLCLSVSVRVRLSVTSRSSTKTAKHRITQTTQHDSPGTLVFWCQRSPRNSTGVTPYEGAECRWGGSKLATFDE